MNRSGNVVGRQIARVRNAKGMSQAELAAACQRLGWDLSRDVLARIEIMVRSITDRELVILAAALKSTISEIVTLEIEREVLASASGDDFIPQEK